MHPVVLIYLKHTSSLFMYYDVMLKTQWTQLATLLNQSSELYIFHEDSGFMIMVWQRPLLWKARCYNAGAGVQNTNTGITLGLKTFLLLCWRLLGGTGWRCLQPTGCSKISIHTLEANRAGVQWKSSAFVRQMVPALQGDTSVGSRCGFESLGLVL